MITFLQLLGGWCLISVIATTMICLILAGVKNRDRY